MILGSLIFSYQNSFSPSMRVSWLLSGCYLFRILSQTPPLCKRTAEGQSPQGVIRQVNSTPDNPPVQVAWGGEETVRTGRNEPRIGVPAMTRDLHAARVLC